MNDMEGLISCIPKKSVLHLDIMQGRRWCGSVSLNVTPGTEYGYDELKSFVRIKRPSLANREFDLMPTDTPVLR